MLVYTNATLTKIAAPGTTDDYDVEASAGATRWSGSTGVTIRRDPIVEVQGAQALNVVRTTRMEIPYDIGRLIEHDDTLTYEYEDRQWTRQANDITRAPLVGRVRVELSQNGTSAQLAEHLLLSPDTLLGSDSLLG